MLEQAGADRNASFLAEISAGSGLEADACVPRRLLHLTKIFQFAQRDAARKFLPVELPAARHFNFDLFRQRVDDRRADAVQSAGGFVGTLESNLPPACRVAHDDFERGFASGNFGWGSTGMPRPLSDHGDKASCRASRVNLDEGRSGPATASSIANCRCTSAKR